MRYLVLFLSVLSFGQSVDWSQIKNEPTILLNAQDHKFTRTNGQGASGDLSVAGSSKVVTVTPCPKGVAGTDTSHYIYVSGGTGSAESVLITGGTCTSAASTGTVIFTTINTHTGSWALSSATQGIDEAARVLGAAGGVVNTADGLSTPNYVNYTLFHPDISLVGIHEFNTSVTGIGGLGGQGGIIRSAGRFNTYTSTARRTFTLMGNAYSTAPAAVGILYTDQVGVYGSGTALSGGGAGVWGGNFLASVESGAGDASIIGAEFNVNNNSRALANEADLLNPVTTQMICGGTYQCKWAMVVAKGTGANNFYGGIKFLADSVQHYALDVSFLANTVLYPIRLNNNGHLTGSDAAYTKIFPLIGTNTLDQVVINGAFNSAGNEADVVVGIGSAAGRSANFVNSANENVLRLDGSGGIELRKTTTFLGLGAPTGKTIIFCTDCNVASPCTAGVGAGAWAFYNGSTWKCPF